jgi:hypothetical protein
MRNLVEKKTRKGEENKNESLQVSFFSLLSLRTKLFRKIDPKYKQIFLILYGFI